MGLLNKKRVDDEFNYQTDDVLIVFDNDKMTSDIKRVDCIVDEAVQVTGIYKIPLDDCEVTVGSNGRNYFYRAPTKSIVETERLAKLEFNTVLTQITAYKPPVPPSSMDWTKGLLFATLFIAFIVVAIVA